MIVASYGYLSGVNVRECDYYPCEHDRCFVSDMELKSDI